MNNKERIVKTVNTVKKVGEKVLVPAAIIGTLTLTGCRGVEVNKADIDGLKPATVTTTVTATPTESIDQAFARGKAAQQAEQAKIDQAKADQAKADQAKIDQANADAKKAEAALNAEKAKNANIYPVPGYPNGVRPDFGQPIDISRLVASSEIYQPTWGTTLQRNVGPNQTGIISGGQMNVNYVDQNGYTRTQSFVGGPGRVTLFLKLGGQSYSGIIEADNVVPGQNWVGIYNTQDWQSLMNAKIQETMTQSSSVPGGARTVDVVVQDASGRILFQNTLNNGNWNWNGNWNGNGNWYFDGSNWLQR